MTQRLPITKTHKLYIKGAYVRSESGRSIEITEPNGSISHLCRASKKDMREAVVAARGALDGWMNRSAYNRGQMWYRIAEMLEGRKDEFEAALAGKSKSPSPQPSPRGRGSKSGSPSPKGSMNEVEATIDRMIAFAGWADKFQQVLGVNNPVNGPFYNFTVPEATGVIAIIAPDEPALLGMVSLMAPALCCGCTVVVLASETNMIPACLLAEVCGVSDVPAGVVNILTGYREDLLTHIAEHRDIDGIQAAGVSEDERVLLRSGAAENLKRVKVHKLTKNDWFDEDACENQWQIESVVEMKTIWHPSAT